MWLTYFIDRSNIYSGEEKIENCEMSILHEKITKKRIKADWSTQYLWLSTFVGVLVLKLVCNLMSFVVMHIINI